jgi:hypothetical protein
MVDVFVRLLCFAHARFHDHRRIQQAGHPRRSDRGRSAARIEIPRRELQIEQESLSRRLLNLRKRGEANGGLPRLQGSVRINMAGISKDNVDPLCEAISDDVKA